MSSICWKLFSDSQRRHTVFLLVIMESNSLQVPFFFYPQQPTVHWLHLIPKLLTKLAWSRLIYARPRIKVGWPDLVPFRWDWVLALSPLPPHPLNVLGERNKPGLELNWFSDFRCCFVWLDGFFRSFFLRAGIWWGKGLEMEGRILIPKSLIWMCWIKTLLWNKSSHPWPILFTLELGSAQMHSNW